MRLSTLAALVLALGLWAPSANAQFARAHGSATGDGKPVATKPLSAPIPAASSAFGPGTLSLDDGTAENSIGLTNGGQFVWFNRFTPPAAAFPLFMQTADVLFTTDGGFSVGSMYDVYVYSDADGNPSNGATYVGGATGQTVTALDAFIPTVLPGLSIATPGDVLIVVVNRSNTGAGIFPAAIDETATAGRSFVGFTSGGNPGTPPDLAALAPQTIEAASGGAISGNWMIRGSYTSQPISGPNLIASPGAVAFGQVANGTPSAAQTVTLINNGDAPVTISSITGSGAPFAVSTTGTMFTLAPGASTTFTVTFTPPADGPATGSVTVTSNAQNSPVTITLSGTGFSPPPNDNVANATPITTNGTYTGTNVAATLEPGEPVATCQANSNASVWWTFTPTVTGSIAIDLSGSDPLDTVLSVYVAGQTEIGCDDDSGAGFTSLLTGVPVTAGQPVLIRIAGYAANEGPISFTFTFTAGAIPRPPNDDIANATPITANGTYTGTNVDATIEAGEAPASCQANTGHSVWWRFTPQTAGLLTVDLSASGFDTVVSAYQPAGTEVGCDDDGGAGLTSLLTSVPVAAGQPVYIRVAGYATRTGAISFDFTFTGTIVAGESAPTSARTFLSATPNPVHGASTVRFASATAQTVTVAVYDVTGRQVATLFQGAVAADQQVEAALNASVLAPGVYVVRATGTEMNLTQRVTVVR